VLKYDLIRLGHMLFGTKDCAQSIVGRVSDMKRPSSTSSLGNMMYASLVPNGKLPIWLLTNVPLVQAVTDIPCIMFTEELLEAYPDAKVLITVRDEDSWLRSVMGLFNTLLGWNWGFIAQYNKPFIQDYVEMIGFVWDIWTGGDHSDEAKLRQTFRDHYALVRSKVPKDKLLVFNPKQGWEPLCKHLGITKVPTEPYPNINELPFTIKIFKIIWWTTALKAAQMIALKTLVPGAMVGAGLWYWMFM
jgi:Sulfotransferase domain